ncbi:conserved hypothetical protein [Talaromyces stipitatus ATCC 10500]|uniref:Extracellular conserved serine-rich protein n=1 Tax=Talaromyces stipitatus (strain ATCC 10500 / CBS 375.48 / QM 6759 / NRRL 1006) TaxID=441959 RepID=B8MMJ6_TALSN|nr:uncharacterized protein TSTA_099980 [Talaromyces stipitatus ATCC 10500]XP_002485990.1 uncharacterized protein TSTA_099980 [Talaromyces stipitatus ATCC 10500]EED13750.1 conserved hypothetical protein [Talaromyces stipitatus ATCC 10500]EED13752.1 conserved hypothetical protein [Talaromyces stipitatus ATCC 10500]
MHSFLPVSLVATATFFSAAQGINILKPTDGDTVDATKGFDVVWTYDSSDFTNWEIELANPAPGKLVATDVTQSPITGTATSTFSYHVAAFTGVADGGNYHVVLDPRNGGTGAFPESGEFTVVNGGGDGSGSSTTTSGFTSGSSSTTTSASATSTTTSISSTPPLISETSTTTTSSSTAVIISSGSPAIASSTPVSTTTGTTTTSVTGIPTSATVIPPISVSTGGNSTITMSSTSFSTFVSGSVTSLVPQSTIIKTTVVPGGSGATGSGTKAPTSSPTIALAAGGSAAPHMGLLSSVVGAILGVFML